MGCCPEGHRYEGALIRAVLAIRYHFGTSARIFATFTLHYSYAKLIGAFMRLPSPALSLMLLVAFPLCSGAQTLNKRYVGPFAS